MYANNTTILEALHILIQFKQINKYNVHKMYNV